MAILLHLKSGDPQHSNYGLMENDILKLVYRLSDDEQTAELIGIYDANTVYKDTDIIISADWADLDKTVTWNEGTKIRNVKRLYYQTKVLYYNS